MTSHCLATLKEWQAFANRLWLSVFIWRLRCDSYLNVIPHNDNESQLRRSPRITSYSTVPVSLISREKKQTNKRLVQAVTHHLCCWRLPLWRHTAQWSLWIRAPITWVSREVSRNNGYYYSLLRIINRGLHAACCRDHRDPQLQPFERIHILEARGHHFLPGAAAAAAANCLRLLRDNDKRLLNLRTYCSLWSCRYCRRCERLEVN